MRLLPILATALLADAFTAMTAPFTFLEPVSPPRPFQTIAHRGQATQAPENSRPALERCIEDGIEWAEVDVRLTRDGLHVLAHDAALADATGRSLAVRDHTLAELSALDLGAAFAARYRATHLLTLEDALELCRGRLNLYLDCKAVDPERLARAILDARMQQQVVVYAGPDVLAQVRAAAGSRLALMAKWRPGEDPAGWAARLGLAAVEIDPPDLDPDTSAKFRGAGVKVEAKLLGDADVPAHWERALAAGADWFQTDRPEEVLYHLRRRQLPPWPMRMSLHRGASRYAPENTLPAFELAARLGADFIEFDVRAGQDGTHFLLHDGRLNRTTDGQGPLADQTAETIARLSAGAWFGRAFAETRVPTFETFLAAFPGRPAGTARARTALAGSPELYCDAKSVAPERLVEALRRHSRIASTVVYQSAEYLARLRAIEPALRRMPPLGRAADLDGLLERVEPYAVDTDWDILSAELIARCHARGVRVFSDALGDHERIEDYRRAIGWGIDLIQTDHPLRVLRAIELWAAEKKP